MADLSCFPSLLGWCSSSLCPVTSRQNELLGFLHDFLSHCKTLCFLLTRKFLSPVTPLCDINVWLHFRPHHIETIFCLFVCFLCFVSFQFWDYLKLYHFSLSLLPSEHLDILLIAFFQLHASSLHYWCPMHICKHMYIPKYNLTHLYNVTCMYVFMPHHLAWNDWLVCSSLRKIIFPPFSSNF